MDKNVIRKYAVWARNELIARATQKAQKYGFTKEEMIPGNADSVNGMLLSDTEKKQRQAMIKEIHEKGLEQVIEEISYTWFNRFAALRFMEVNGYLPSHVRVFTDADNHFKPQILTEAIYLELDGLDRGRVYALKQDNKTEELFRYLLITQCNALSKILPGMFQKISDYTELMLPDNLLREGSVIEQMVTMIPEEDWTDQVQIIGWLYQYYNTEPKDRVFADLKKNIKISREKIPAATQLFTPDWIVHYMVENSLGRLWIEKKTGSGELVSPAVVPAAGEGSTFSSALSAGEDACEAGKGASPGEQFAGSMGWKYYLPEAQQEPEVAAQLAGIRKEYAALKPEEIRCIDPCMGSGHILCVLFDTLVQIYEDYGYTAREAARSIVENNLWGLDIDERAAQLSYFAVMMKARQYDRRFLSRKDENGEPDIPQPHVLAVAESNRVDEEAVKYFCHGDAALTAAMQTIIEELHDAKEYGSILTVTEQDWPALHARFDEIRDDISMFKDSALAPEPLVQTAQALGQKYHVTVTNPPYAGVSNLHADVANYVKKHYPDSKSDLFAVFIERCGELTVRNGYQAMITQHAWMFLSSFEKLRTKLLSKDTVNMAHLGARAFEEIGGEVVQTTSFVLRSTQTDGYQGTYCRLIEPTTQDGKEQLFLSGEKRFTARQDNFSKIPGSPVAYWVSAAVIHAFTKFDLLGSKFTLLAGTSTGDNDLYQRNWYEVSVKHISRTAPDDLTRRWYPCNTGGEFRKYSLNSPVLIDWEDDGKRIRNHINSKGKIGSAVRNRSYFFKTGLTWNKLSSTNFGVRFVPSGYISDDTARMIMVESDRMFSLLGFLCSKVCKYFLELLSPTLSFTNSELQRLPLSDKIFDPTIEKIALENLSISRDDGDMFETSWDFRRHPMVPSLADKREQMMSQFHETRMQGFSRISFHYEYWSQECKSRFRTLKSNEEELNRIFIDIYGLQDELTPEVAEKDVTVRRYFDTKDDIPESMRGSNYALTRQDAVKSLISYAVGCMFGRYSLYTEGLFYAGGSWDYGSRAEALSEAARAAGAGDWNPSALYLPDRDNIIPVCDDEYFTDDIVGLFVKFIGTVYGADTLEENLRFIADALGGRGTSREVIRNYFLNDFYKDHLKTYQKRPIYWLFDSGKKNGFKCLIYMHRYKPDTIARIRTDYVHEQQSRYRTAIADLEKRAGGASTSERVKLNRQLQKLRAQNTELRLYEEKIHHLADQYIQIDLDDGVKVNYAKFQDVLAKIS